MCLIFHTCFLRSEFYDKQINVKMVKNNVCIVKTSWLQSRMSWVGALTAREKEGTGRNIIIWVEISSLTAMTRIRCVCIYCTCI